MFPERPTHDKPNILILCTGNSCRRHLAEGILGAVAGDIANIQGTSSKPAGDVHPLAVEAMAEIGIDISGHRLKHMNEFLNQPVPTVITVCGNADQAFPIFSGQMNWHHWPFADPAHVMGSAAGQMEVFRHVRDEIRCACGASADGLQDADK